MAAAATCLPHFFTVTAASTFFPRLDVGISEKKTRYSIPKSSGARMFPVTMAGCLFSPG